MPSRDALIDWLFSLQGPALKWDLDTAEAFSDYLGRPDRSFRSLHVAGTNGKGSVAAMAQAISLAHGVSAGLYTSPHLVRPEERIRVGADDIAEDSFRGLIGRMRVAAEQALATSSLPRHPSFFEIMTAAAFVAFAENKVNFAIVEAGLGGRLDATNVITPVLAVITTIGLDHVKTLGGDLASIAREKAGIFKRGVPALVGWTPARVRPVIEDAARRCAAPLHWAAEELRVRRRDDGTFDVHTPERSVRRLRCALAGPHQARNAALAIRSLELSLSSSRALDADAIARGLQCVRWPGRLEIIERPANAAASRFLLDGAHNTDGARALARALGERKHDRLAQPRVLVFGMTEGRDARRLIGPLRPFIDRVVVSRPGIVKAIDPERIAAALSFHAPELAPEIVENPAEALDRAAALAGPHGEVLEAGSLYLVGDARRALLGLPPGGHPQREMVFSDATRGAQR